jgi:hypothetical protein
MRQYLFEPFPIMTNEQQKKRQKAFPPLIFPMLWEIIAMVLIEDKNFELTLAKTCKKLYECYEHYYQGKTAAVIYKPRHKFSIYEDFIKVHQLHHGWLRLKFASISDSQSSNCPVSILCLHGELNMLEKLDCVCVNSLIIRHSYKKSMPAVSIVESFSNLKSLIFDNVSLDDHDISMISKLSLEFIYLKYCGMTSGHLQEIFEHCTTLQTIQLMACEFSDEPFIRRLPPQLEKFETHSHFCKLDASMCTRLETL